MSNNDIQPPPPPPPMMGSLPHGPPMMGGSSGPPPPPGPTNMMGHNVPLPMNMGPMMQGGPDNIGFNDRMNRRPHPNDGEDMRGGPGGFDRPPFPDRFNNMPPRDRFDGPSGPPGNFDGPPGPPNRFDGPPGSFDGPPPRHFDGPPGGFDGPPGGFDGPPGGFDGPPGSFDGPPGSGPSGPGGFDGPPGGFEGPSGPSGFDNHDEYRGEPEMYDERAPRRGSPQPLMGRRVEPTKDFERRLKEDEKSGKKGRDFRLPAALEKMLAYKDERAKEVGVSNEEVKKAMEGKLELEKATEPANETTMSEQKRRLEEIKAEITKQYVEDTKPGNLPLTKSEVAEQARKALKNRKKKEKKKRRNVQKKKEKEEKEITKDAQPPAEKGEIDAVKQEKDVEIEYVADTPSFNDPYLYEFKKVFEAFKIAEEIEKVTADSTIDGKDAKSKLKQPKPIKEESSDDEAEDDKPKVSKRQLRRMNRLSVAELKQLVSRPDVVEMHDVTAQDPRLLVHLKATRNSVPVPRHWCFKRKYLQGKRGIEKPPFDLPDFIKSTGIMEMRQALQEKEDQRTMKSKMREKVRPKMGKIDIDYQKLHDAFFRYQTKPRMTIHGDLYYENKEFETRLKEKKPGILSDELRTALGMPIGHNKEKIPPPWLIAMQRYGPPPSYPNLKVAGLNAPIPESCSFGYHVGGWGKPPVDEMGKPLYGDVFGVQVGEYDDLGDNDEVDKTPWGELESESEEESSSEEEEEDQQQPDATGFITPAESGMVTPSGISSVPTGMETPDMIELRKKKIEDAMEGGETPELYTVLPEKSAGMVGRSMMASSHVYDIAGAKRAQGTGASDQAGVEVALNPEELELDTAAMAAKYEERVREQQAQVEKEDFSDMVAEHAAKQKKKRKAQTQEPGRATKKYKEFKF
ncbi:splicing factor 3B subunit 2-like [Styela clava]